MLMHSSAQSHVSLHEQPQMSKLKGTSKKKPLRLRISFLSVSGFLVRKAAAFGLFCENHHKILSK